MSYDRCPCHLCSRYKSFLKIIKKWYQCWYINVFQQSPDLFFREQFHFIFPPFCIPPPHWSTFMTVKMPHACVCMENEYNMQLNTTVHEYFFAFCLSTILGSYEYYLPAWKENTAWICSGKMKGSQYVDGKTTRYLCLCLSETLQFCFSKSWFPCFVIL